MFTHQPPEIEPKSPVKTSRMKRFHVPFGFVPRNAPSVYANGDAGVAAGAGAAKLRRPACAVGL